MPGFQGIQTFGPGYVFKMPGSGFKKEARAKQRLSEVEAEKKAPKAGRGYRIPRQGAGTIVLIGSPNSGWPRSGHATIPLR